MKERGLLMAAGGVKATLAELKTHTRRLKGLDEVNKNPDQWIRSGGAIRFPDETPLFCFQNPNEMRDLMARELRIACPYGKPGDRLWVRETWGECMWGIKYKASSCDCGAIGVCEMKWKPSIFMPRWASRILLEIEEIRVERVQDISYEDILAEGWNVQESKPITNGTAGEDARDWWVSLWNSLNEKRGYGFDKNNWVWVIIFKLLKKG